jgi:hypothetical protein
MSMFLETALAAETHLAEAVIFKWGMYIKNTVVGNSISHF